MKNLVLFALTTMFLFACGGGGNTPESVIPDNQLTTSEAYTAVLEQHSVPAIGGAYIEGSEVMEQFALGNRVEGDSTPVLMSDRWHIGSVTKSFTSTLAAKLIELGYMDWDMRISDVFEVNEYNQKYADVTLEQLLSHTGGIHGEIMDVQGWLDYFTSTEDILIQRSMLANKLMHMSGNQIGDFNYSNGGYVIAGTMIERVMNINWEELLSEYILMPLGINDVQFGAPYDGTKNSQPYGHDLINGDWHPVSPNDPFSDNPTAMGPAGTLSMSMDSLILYTMAHITGVSGQSTLLDQASFEKLHSKMPGTNYAMGWFIDGTNIYHMGSNTMWYAHIGIDFGTKTVGVIAVTNVGGDRGVAVTDNIINVLLDRNY